MEYESRNDGWISPLQRPDEELQTKICALSKLSSVLSKSEDSHLDSHANIEVCSKHCYILSPSGVTATVSAFAKDVCKNANTDCRCYYFIQLS